MSFIHWLLSILSPAKYKNENGRLYIKQAFHSWEPLLEHLKREHPDEPNLAKDLEVEETRGGSRK